MKIKSSQHLNSTQVNQLLNHLHRKGHDFYYIYVKISIHTALRFNDLRTITWGQILNRPLVTIIESKTKKIREVPIPPELQREILYAYNKIQPPGLDSKFISLTIRTINKQIKIHAYRAGIRDKRISTHTWRKTFGREVWRRNNKSEESLVILSQLFNHSSLSITRTYLDITREEVLQLYDLKGFMD